ncbi:Polyadenylate-binding protein RBP47B [Quillaja saponaria]|uniref:Polyadenylate-binding protein RBP47B n=1 Tax=Quillaja saponaria TaxID=32244 RepID=A0AAD7PZV2_QUISA|nr:Polyadenylate-binding protein RBP47B [Quillaja saponaria]
MDPENIDWSNIDSIFVEDDTYENFNAPKWVDLCASDALIDDEAWFCKPDCEHPKTVEDFHKSPRYPKVKLLRSMSISAILPFKNSGTAEETSKTLAGKSSNSKALKTKGPNFSKNSHEDSENRNPNFSSPIPSGRTNPKKQTMKASNKNIQKLDGSLENSTNYDRKPRLKNTFSARNLFTGREILNQITEFCSEMKKLAVKNSKRETVEKVSEVKDALAEREKMPLLLVKEEGKALTERTM